MIRLHYLAHTRAGRVRWILNELNLPYEIINAEMKEGDQQYHPLMLVPVLEDCAIRVFESVAICLYLADRYRTSEFSLAPAPDNWSERATYYEALIFLTSEVEPVLEQYEKANELKEKFSLKTKLSLRLDWLEKRLSIQPYLLDTGFSAADIIAQSLLSWCLKLDLLHDRILLTDYVTKINQRPARIESLRTN